MPGRRVLLLCWLTSVTAAVAAEGSQISTPQSQPPAGAPPAESRVQFYGFVRQDVIFDDSRPDAFQTPLFILSEPDGASNLENLTMHPRLTRLGVDVSGPVLDSLAGARVSGRFELDFQNGGRESRAIPRYRHAYLTLAWSSASLLVGQTSDTISPLFPAVNADTLMWNAGNLGDRRPQVRLTLRPAADGPPWSFAIGAGLTGAVDGQDLDGDNVRDGEAAALPNVQARVALSYQAAASRRGSAGLWGHVARQQVSVPVAGETDFGSHAIGVDVEVPLGRRAVVRGEAWTGRNLSDVRGGIGQSINRATGGEIGSRGGWVEVGGDLTVRYSLVVGYTIDAPDAGDVPAGGRTRNAAWFIVNRWNAGRPVGFGVDYLRWRTEHRGSPDGTDNRVNAYATYTF